MKTSAYLSRLRADMDRWVAAGLLTPELADTLTADAAKEAGQKAEGSSWLPVLGMTAVLLGLLTIIAANWAGLNGYTRLAILFALVTASTIGSAELKVRGLAVGSNLAASAAAVLIGGGLVVIGQLYNTGATTAAFMTTWSIFASAIAIVLWSPLAAGVAAILTVLWILIEFNLIDGASLFPDKLDALGVLLALGAMALVRRSLFVVNLVIVGLICVVGPELHRFVSDLIGPEWDDVGLLSYLLVFTAPWAVIAAGAELIARTTQAFAARTLAGWSTWIASGWLLSAVTVARFDESSGWLIPIVALILFAALTGYGAPRGRRWLRGAGTTGFIFTVAVQFLWSASLFLSGLSLIVFGVLLISLLNVTSKWARRNDADEVAT